MDQPNIIHIVAKIKTLKEFNKLIFFVPNTSIVSAIPKTIVFVNSFDDRMQLAYHLCNLLLVYMKNDRKKIITTFTFIFEPDAKEEYLINFYNDDIRI